MSKYRATYHKLELIFTETRKTSRKALQNKLSFFIEVWDIDTGKKGIGECSYIPGLNTENVQEYEAKIIEVCNNINSWKIYLKDGLIHFPSIRFGLDCAIKSAKSIDPSILFNNDFVSENTPLKINGLVWMGDFHYMKQQIEEKLTQGFSCIKIKIGGIDFQEELKLLEFVRNQSEKVTIRLDANGAFTPENALTKLNSLAEFDIHSIEQPIKPYQHHNMYEICEKSPISIALDEELVGHFTFTSKNNLLNQTNPHFLVLKPSLLGGFDQTEEWISLATKRNIGWWVTSYLESNIGLNAIAQFTATHQNSLPQGLGTGKLFENNIENSLTLKGENLYFKNPDHA